MKSPTVSIIRSALKIVSKETLRNRAKIVRDQQLNLGYEEPFLTGACLEVAARELIQNHSKENP